MSAANMCTGRKAEDVTDGSCGGWWLCRTVSHTGSLRDFSRWRRPADIMRLWGIHLTGVERDWGNGTSPCQHSLP